MTWEYMVLNSEVHRNDLFAEISRAGKNGWELVGPIGYYIYLKRPTPSDREGGE